MAGVEGDTFGTGLLRLCVGAAGADTRGVVESDEGVLIVGAGTALLP